MQNILLFAISSLIWGSTWIMITFQLGKVDPIVSVVYRFGLASVILFIYCLATQKKLKFTAKEHLLIFTQGLFLFGFNYWFTYLAIENINSALAAVLSTSIVYFNVLFARVFLGDSIRSEVLIGATIGVVGIILIFLPEIKISEQAFTAKQGILLVLAGSLFASLGNIVSAKSQRKKIPVIEANAFSMGYGALFIGVIALISGKTFNFDWNFTYIGSLLYLSIFGSIIAFSVFLTLLGRIGPDKAGYVTLVYPVIAMLLSTFFEAYQWSPEAIFGLLAILLGNFVAMGKYKQLTIYKKRFNAFNKTQK